MAPNGAKKKARKSSTKVVRRSWPAGAISYPQTGFKEYAPDLRVICTTLKRSGIEALLNDFKNPDQKFKVLMVKGSPFVSLSISPTRGGND